MPDVLFNLLLLFSAVIFLGVLVRAWRVTRAQRRGAGTESGRHDTVACNDPERVN